MIALEIVRIPTGSFFTVLESARKRLHYSPETGVFTWIEPAGRAIKPGTVAGYTERRGYLSIRLEGKLHFAHRLAWLWMTGEWPKQQVDHINGDKSDNRWANLRDVSRAVNMQNLRGPTSNNKTSGLLGASWAVNTKRWQAQIKANGVLYPLGHYDTPEEAHQVYLKAKRVLHAGCTI